MKKIIVVFFIFFGFALVSKAQQATLVNSTSGTKSATDVKVIKNDETKKGMTASSGEKIVSDSLKNNTTTKSEAKPANPFIREERKTAIEKK